MKMFGISIVLLILAVGQTYGQNGKSRSELDLERQAAIANLPPETPYVVKENGGHHRVWQKTVYELGPGNRVVPRVREFTELATGLNYQDAQGQWQESREIIESFVGGAVARQGQHRVLFANDLATAGAIDMQTPEGKRLRSHVLGLSYYDTATGNNVFFAEVTNCQGVVVNGNQVLYENAFTELKADVLYRYTRDGFEQDVILHERPPLPENYGMDSRTTHLQIFTEFLSPPTPAVRDSLIASGAEDEEKLRDESLDFGTMRIGAGKAFHFDSAENHDSPAIPVAKQWLQLEGRWILVEEVTIPAAAKQLDSLPLPGHASGTSTNGVTRRTASLRRLLPPPRTARMASTNKMQMAKFAVPLKGFVLDYNTVNTSMTNFTFQGDTTYYLSANAKLYGTNNTFEGGSVLKFASNVTLTVNAPVTWLGDNYRPVVLTAKDDNRVGEAISGSTGSPGTKPYANRALDFDATAAGTSLVVGNLRIANAKVGVSINGGADHVLSHVQMLNCGNGMAATNTDFSLLNALFYNVQTNFTGSQSTGRVEHLTVNVANWLNRNIGTNLFLTNCLLVAVTNTGDYTGQNVKAASAGSGVFQTAGAASHYLVTGSTNRNTGTTNINTDLLADLKKMTTYPPIIYSNTTISTATTFNPQAQRDTDAPDLGYHYDPLDYVFGGVTATADLTFAAGTAAGWFEPGGNYAIYMGDDLVTAFNGTLKAPCFFARYETVQEGGNGIWSDKGVYGGIMGAGDYYTVHPTHIKASFTRFASTSGDPAPYRDFYGILELSASHCEYWSGSLGGYVTLGHYTNCLMDRVSSWNGADAPAPEMIFRNCTFHGGSLAFAHWEGGSPYWYSSIRNCAFDGTALAMDYADPAYTDYDFNAYLTGADQTNPTGAGDLDVGSTFNWQSSWLGRFYLPSDSSLIDLGGCFAYQTGLYQFTTQTGQTPEYDTTVDIGYHYVAVDGNGNPNDSDSDGIPDYLEDTNGNGLVDSGETDWQSAADLGLKVIITRPGKNSILP